MKNKIFLGLILGIFLIGLVSASITGYLVTRGGGIADGGYTAVLQKVEGTTAIVSVQTPTGDTELVRVAEGKTAQVGAATISASSLTRGTLFRRAGANIALNISNISAAPVPIKVPGAIFSSGNQTNVSVGTLTNVTEEECSENCQTFTEVHKVKEGQTISLEGESVSISFISATEVILLVNNLPTALLSEGDTFEIGNGRVVVIKEIKKLEVAGSIGLVELGVLSSYKLKEGQTISLEGESVSISFISATEVILLVNNLPTALLSEGDTFEILGSGQIVTIQNVAKLEVAGNIGWVIFNPSACYFPNF